MTEWGWTQMMDFFTVNHCMPYALRLLSEAITTSVFKARFGPRRGAAVMAIREDCIGMLLVALQRTRNYTYTKYLSKFILCLEDLSRCAGSGTKKQMIQRWSLKEWMKNTGNFCWNRVCLKDSVPDWATTTTWMRPATIGRNGHYSRQRLSGNTRWRSLICTSHCIWLRQLHRRMLYLIGWIRDRWLVLCAVWKSFHFWSSCSFPSCSALQKTQENIRYFLFVWRREIVVRNAYDMRSPTVLIQGSSFCFVSRV